MAETRVGIGYDVHRLVEGRPLVLGGVTIPSDRGLLGHSDADVALHAIIDALLGAAALGDIGQHFPPDAPAYKDSDSRRLLALVRDLLDERGWSVINLDCTIIAERPKIMPHAPAMRAALAETLALAPDCIGIKATTNEGIGFIGREEGIAAMAVALIEREEQNSLVASFQATLDLLSTEEGGRETPFASGYRSAFYLPAYGNYNDVVIMIEDRASGLCGPGEQCTANLTFFRPEYVPGVLAEGLSFEVREGGRTVARGVITRILKTVSEDQIGQIRRREAARWRSSQELRNSPSAPTPQEREEEQE